MVRDLLRGTHDDQSPLHQLRAQHRLLEEIIKPLVPELFLNALLAEMVKANPDTTEERLRRGLILHRDGSIDAWSLGYRSLSVLPELFGGVRTTGNLWLNHNKLTSLHESFGSITVGGNLRLQENKLSSLPESFGSIAVGGDLVLSHNKLRSMPESFGSIRVAGNLELSYNQLKPKDIPAHLFTNVGGHLTLR